EAGRSLRSGFDGAEGIGQTAGSRGRGAGRGRRESPRREMAIGGRGFDMVHEGPTPGGSTPQGDGRDGASHEMIAEKPAAAPPTPPEPAPPTRSLEEVNSTIPIPARPGWRRFFAFSGP